MPRTTDPTSAVVHVGQLEQLDSAMSSSSGCPSGHVLPTGASGTSGGPMTVAPDESRDGAPSAYVCASDAEVNLTQDLTDIMDADAAAHAPAPTPAASPVSLSPAVKPCDDLTLSQLCKRPCADPEAKAAWRARVAQQRAACEAAKATKRMTAAKSRAKKTAAAIDAAVAHHYAGTEASTAPVPAPTPPRPRGRQRKSQSDIVEARPCAPDMDAWMRPGWTGLAISCLGLMPGHCHHRTAAIDPHLSTAMVCPSRAIHVLLIANSSGAC